MTDAEKLAMLKNMVEPGDTDAVLSTYLTLAAKTILAKAYPYNPEITDVPAQ